MHMRPEIEANRRVFLMQNRSPRHALGYVENNVRILPGEAKTTELEDTVLVTVLGSCIAACVRDPISGLGGMNHFMLPQASNLNLDDPLDSALRYGNYAMEALINMIMRSSLCARNQLEVKVFGGASLGFHSGLQVGRRNCEFVLQYLKDEGIPLIAHDLGGHLARRIHYHPKTGVVHQVYIRTDATQAVRRDERAYAKSIAKPSDEGGAVELF